MTCHYQHNECCAYTLLLRWHNYYYNVARACVKTFIVDLSKLLFANARRGRRERKTICDFRDVFQYNNAMIRTYFKPDAKLQRNVV